MKCVGIKFKTLDEITPKAVKATTYDGGEYILPKSQVLAFEGDITWISEWIAKKKGINYSTKRVGWFNGSSVKPFVDIVKHVPEQIYKETVCNNKLKRV